MMPTNVRADDAAADIAGYCQDAQTTADIVKCTNTRLQDENEKLARLFGSVTSEFEDAVIKKQFIDNQKNGWNSVTKLVHWKHNHTKAGLWRGCKNWPV